MQSPPRDDDGRSSVSTCDAAAAVRTPPPDVGRLEDDTARTPPTTSPATVLSNDDDDDDGSGGGGGGREEESSMERRYVARGKCRTNWCYLCETMQTKLIRHMKAKHGHAPEVRRYLLTTDPDPAVQRKKRKAMCRDIANKSNHQYNERLAATAARGAHLLLPVKRSRKSEVSRLSHVVCPACKGLVTRKHYASHAKNCGSRSGPKSTFLLPPLDARYDGLREHVFPNMSKDEICYVAQTDELILQYGRRFFQTHRSHHQRYYVSSQIRTLADLLIRFRKAAPDRVNTLADCLDPINFDGLCAVVRDWCGMDVANGRCRVGSVPRRLCKSLKVCSKILWFEAMKNKDLPIERQLEIRDKHERFTALMECDWSMEVNHAADKSLKIGKMRKEDKMPLSDDVAKFFDVMTKEIKRAAARLRTGHDVVSYADLTKACIVYLTVYNCRRPSEVVYATVDNYKTTLKTKNDTAVFTVAALKNDVKVPIIVTPVVRSAVDSLLTHRSRLGAKGDLLFGRLDGTAYNGGNLINAFTADMNLEKPDDLSANGLRHYLATVSQLDPGIKSHIPKFLGHTLSTHQRFYEMPMSDILLDRIAPSLSRLCRISEDGDNAAATVEPTRDLPSSSSIDYDDPIPSTSAGKTTAGYCCGIVPLDVRDRNSTPPLSSFSRVDDAELSENTSLSPPRRRTQLGVQLRKRTSWPVVAATGDTESEPGGSADNDDPRKDPDFVACTSPSEMKETVVGGTDDTRDETAIATPASSDDTDSDMFASPIRVVRQKNRWTTPERKELYEGLPRTMLGLRRAERGEIRRVWQNSRFIKKRHSLQTTRIEVSKHFTRKVRIATPVRKTILESVNVSE